ncbi:glycosyltransferase family 1 protein [Temperatibacter marinus]|uniref:Glycosyltransferase family 1 protein n=1 Tax=Temperatibacter marinus TaxID=1456591 RepID=A0AA52EFG0_9PROT|nr:glycosyltransferase family 1 protein [Temperatibacter marinus]WND02698.1 glycosyltransferase family 1 protein [Temperatibacter marinus]
MPASKLKIALFSGNYNYVKDGANQALNKLVAYLEKQGVEVRVYSPTSKTPAFEPAGTLISIPSWPIPTRKEYRIAFRLPKEIIANLDEFAPDIIHISSPDWASQKAIKYATKRGLPVVASVHTRFETYMSYYKLGWVEGMMSRKIAKIYNTCNEIFIPTPCMEDVLRPTGVTVPMKTWTRGIDLEQYSPNNRDEKWRLSQGFSANDCVISFVGRIVLEKGLQVFADTMNILRKRGLEFKVVVAGEGPKKAWFHQRMPYAHFVGFQTGADLARTYASSDIFFNPSETETFGNVTLEAMASAVPQVCANASGSKFLVVDGETGFLAHKNTATEYADRIEVLITDPNTRKKFSSHSVKRSEEFHWDSVLGQVLGHYRSLLS